MSELSLGTLWKDLTFVGFDTETTGKYPLTAEICEIAGVKWRAGEVVDTFSTLVKPSKPMGDEVIKIHGITNEMVETAPSIASVIGDFRKFIGGAVPIAHHAPFDLGFVAVEFERAGLTLPTEPVICSSLLSRKVIPESGNHKLQTLIKFLALEQGQAHRALDDAKACLQVALKSMERVGEKALADILATQGGTLGWQRFSMRALEDLDTVGPIVQATREGGEVDFAYGAGSKPGKTRRIRPVGLVRSLDGDFFVGIEPEDSQAKRFFLNKVISAARVV